AHGCVFRLRHLERLATSTQRRRTRGAGARERDGACTGFVGGPSSEGQRERGRLCQSRGTREAGDGAASRHGRPALCNLRSYSRRPNRRVVERRRQAGSYGNSRFALAADFRSTWRAPRSADLGTFGPVGRAMARLLILALSSLVVLALVHNNEPG